MKIDKHTDRLYNAVQNYVEKHDGRLIVIGGVSVIEHPFENKGVFHLAVKCLGDKPVFHPLKSNKKVSNERQANRRRGIARLLRKSPPLPNLDRK